MPKSPNQQAYQKEINRINRFIKSASNRGFIFDREKISELIPEKGSRITKKKIEILKAITPNVLYKEAKYLDPVTKQIVSGRQGRTIEQKRAGRKGWNERLKRIRQQWQALIEITRREMDEITTQFPNAYGHYYMEKYWKEIKNKYGDPDIYIRIIEIPEVKDVISDFDWCSTEEDAKKVATEVYRLLNSVAPLEVLKIRMFLRGFSDEVDEEW